MKVTRSGKTEGPIILREKMIRLSAQLGITFLDLEKMSRELAKAATITAEEMRKLVEVMNTITIDLPNCRTELIRKSSTNPNERIYRKRRFK